MKQYYRIFCPLCGKTSYKKNFDRDNVFKILIQTFGGRANIKYEPCLDVGVLGSFHEFILNRIHALYFRLTGINIPNLNAQVKELSRDVTLHTSSLPIIPSSIPIAVVHPKLTAKIKPNKIKPYRVVVV